QADRNLKLAHKAVEECFVLATGDTGMSKEASAPFRRRLLAATLPYYREFRTRKPNDPAFDLDLARNLTRLATIEAELGEARAAREQANKALTLCVAISRKDNLSANDLQTLADVTNDVGSVQHALGELPRAVEALAVAHALQERVV